MLLIEYIFSKNITKQKTIRVQGLNPAWKIVCIVPSIIYLPSWWLMILKNQYCFVSLFISCFIIEQSGSLILYRASYSFHIAIWFGDFIVGPFSTAITVVLDFYQKSTRIWRASLLTQCYYYLFLVLYNIIRVFFNLS